MKELGSWRRRVRSVDALHIELGEHGGTTFTSAHNNMKPDLYSLAKNRQLRNLLNVKTSQNTSILYTAIGQMVDHGAAQARSPKRFLVVENPVEDLNFQKALKDRHITVMNFKHDARDQISLPDLDRHHQVLSAH
jgi:hypothetical protein